MLQLGMTVDYIQKFYIANSAPKPERWRYRIWNSPEVEREYKEMITSFVIDAMTKPPNEAISIVKHLVRNFNLPVASDIPGISDFEAYVYDSL